MAQLQEARLQMVLPRKRKRAVRQQRFPAKLLVLLSKLGKPSILPLAEGLEVRKKPRVRTGFRVESGLLSYADAGYEWP